MAPSVEVSNGNAVTVTVFGWSRVEVEGVTVTTVTPGLVVLVEVVSWPAVTYTVDGDSGVTVLVTTLFVNDLDVVDLVVPELSFELPVSVVVVAVFPDKITNDPVFPSVFVTVVGSAVSVADVVVVFATISSNPPKFWARLLVVNNKPSKIRLNISTF